MLHQEALNAACHLLDMFDDNLEKAIEYAVELARHDPVYVETLKQLRNELPPEILEKEALEKKQKQKTHTRNTHIMTTDEIMKYYQEYRP